MNYHNIFLITYRIKVTDSTFGAIEYFYCNFKSIFNLLVKKKMSFAEATQNMNLDTTEHEWYDDCFMAHEKLGSCLKLCLPYFLFYRLGCFFCFSQQETQNISSVM